MTWFPNNQGVPTHHAIIQLFMPETGAPLVTMDGTLITEMRTGAASAVATVGSRLKDAALAMLGSSVQARSQLQALRRSEGSATCASGVHGTRRVRRAIRRARHLLGRGSGARR